MPLFPDFHRTYPPEEPASDESTAWILLHSRGILVHGSRKAAVLPRGETPCDFTDRLGNLYRLGRMNDVRYIAAEVGEDAPFGDEWEVVDLRSLYGCVSEGEWFIAGYASQVAHWHRTSGFCPACGSAMGPTGAEWRRQCLQCAHERYPMVSPAVLALVHDGADRVLLAHKPGWGTRRSILAGFTLPGESLEECVHREVLEEAGVRVADVTYFGSQPWPFPHQIMIGFFSRYVSGDIQIDAEELEGAEWHDFRRLPPLPPALSLSRQMIDAWAQSRRDAAENK